MTGDRWLRHDFSTGFIRHNCVHVLKLHPKQLEDKNSFIRCYPYLYSQYGFKTKDEGKRRRNSMGSLGRMAFGESWKLRRLL
ncbi:hypothetical protein DPMN_171990 [Dreissena polymorpha]|uniref:Uncharacterized protein n=1 Tax=Dreissena polymorpha TaxID=45954 RepID=A0A9D4E0R1_DREPO|nr:hypothetical protein DPMN_171990 [Dreissena polymorpha]